MTTQTLFLASKSPRRRELLTQIGIAHTPVAASVDEHPRVGDSPDTHVTRLAREKANAGLAKLDRQAQHPPFWVLGADTIVICDEQILGKPEDEADAQRMLRLLSGRDHEVITAVAVASVFGRESHASAQTRPDSTCEQVSCRSVVRFRPLSPTEIGAYVRTREPMDKAGAYAIQGLAAMFVARLEGSYSGVMGLPLFETTNLLRGCGFPLPIDPR